MTRLPRSGIVQLQTQKIVTLKFFSFLGKAFLTLLNIALLLAFIAAGVFAFQHREDVMQTVQYYQTGVLYPKAQDVKVEIQDLAGNVLFRGAGNEQSRARALFPEGIPEVHNVMFDVNFRLGTVTFTFAVGPVGKRGWTTEDVEWIHVQPYFVSDQIELTIDRPKGEPYEGTIESFLKAVADGDKTTPFGEELSKERLAQIVGVFDMHHPEHIKGKLRVETILDPR